MHKFALGKSVAKLKKPRSESRAKMVDATFASLFTTPQCFLVCKCEIYLLCLRFTSQFLHLYDIFARNKFEILFFSSKALLARYLASLIKASRPIIASYLEYRLKWIFSSQKVFFLGKVIMFTSPFKIFTFSKNRIKKKKKKNEQPPKFGTL